MRVPVGALALTDQDREMLERISKSRMASHSEVIRATALIMAGPSPRLRKRWMSLRAV